MIEDEFPEPPSRVGPALVIVAAIASGVGSVLNWFRVRIDLPRAPTRVITSRGIDGVDGKLTLILLAAPGDLRIVKTDFDDRLQDEVERYLATDSVVRGD